MASGGRRVPAKPAAVSGPGRFSTRTDSETAQMAAAGGSYGSRQQLEAQQSAAPVPAAGPADPDGVAEGGVPASGEASVFGPTRRPNESPLAGVVGPAQPEPLYDPQVLLRVLADKWPTPWILGMLND